MKKRILATILALVLALSLLPTAALAETGKPVMVGENGYDTLSKAIAAAGPDADGVITYTITGKVEIDSVNSTWIQVLKDGLTNVTAVAFVGASDDAEIVIKNSTSVLADQKYNIDVSFTGLTLSHPNGEWVGDLGHTTNYFACVLRNTGAADNTVTYTNCTFPNGVCNNQYGKTVFDHCKFTNETSEKSNLWNYGGETKVENCSFTGKRGIKMYNEGTLATPPSIEIKNTTFTGMSEKAAIVVSKASDVTLDNVDATDCTVGLLQKDIEGSSGDQKITIPVNGTGISGEFNVTGTIAETVAENEFNISEGTLTAADGTSTVTLDPTYLAPGTSLGEDGTVAKLPVAKVGEEEFSSLTDAFAALTAENHTLTLVDENAWDAATPVYWKTNGAWTAAAKLTDALTAAYIANAGAITIVCRPGADVGTMTHGHVADDLTIYGNNAYISGGECDLEVDTFKFDRATGMNSNSGELLTKDITITAYELDNLGVWGQRSTTHTVNINLNDCDGKDNVTPNVQRVYISGTSGVNNITVTGCDFLTKATALYSNANGSVVIDGCTFTDSQAPINFNHKANGTQTVTVKNSRLTRCGDNGEWKAFAAPIRFVNSGGGTQNAAVEDCTITDTVGNNGDILLGDGRTGKASHDVTLTVTSTAADVQAQQPGYYAADGTVDAAGKVSKTTVPVSETPTTIALTSEEFKLAEVGGTQYNSVAEAITAAQSGSKTITLLTADTALVQSILDGQYGSIDGLTIELAGGNYGAIQLGRATKYEGSNTEYKLKNETKTVAEIKEIIAAHPNGGAGVPQYTRNMNNITLKAADGAAVNVSGMTAFGGKVADSAHYDGYDYVVDRATPNNNTCYYITQKWNNVTFEGLTFTAPVNIEAFESGSEINDLKFKNCTFTVNDDSAQNRCLRLATGGNCKSGGLAVDGCKFTDGFEGVLTIGTKNVTVTNSEFTGITKNAIDLIVGADGYGDVTITNNTFKDMGNGQGAIIRLGEVDADATLTIKNNTASGTLNFKDDRAIKANSVADETKTNISNNNWASLTVNDKKMEDTKSTGGSSYGSRINKKTEDVQDELDFADVSERDYYYDAVKWAAENGIASGVSSTRFGPGLDCTRGQTMTFLWRAMDEPEPETLASSLTDVMSGSYYYKAVLWAMQEGVTTGVGSGLFAPDKTVTRGQFVTFLYRLANASGSGEHPFTDVPAGSYYEAAIAWAYSEGITTGTGSTTFSPDAPCTRAQIITFLYRYFGK